MKRVIFFIGVALVFTSCLPIMKTLYGIKKPKVENFETLQKYLRSIEIDADNLLVPQKLEDIKVVNLEFGNSFPQAVLFDSNGERVTYKTSEQDCNAGLFSVIPTLNKETVLKSEEGKNLSEFIQNLLFLKNQQAVDNLPESDYYLFINWAKYGGKLNKDHVKEWINLARENKNVKISVYKVNMDFQEIWGLELGKKI